MVSSLENEKVIIPYKHYQGIIEWSLYFPNHPDCQKINAVSFLLEFTIISRHDYLILHIKDIHIRSSFCLSFCTIVQICPAVFLFISLTWKVQKVLQSGYKRSQTLLDQSDLTICWNFSMGTNTCSPSVVFLYQSWCFTLTFLFVLWIENMVPKYQLNSRLQSTQGKIYLCESFLAYSKFYKL